MALRYSADELTHLRKSTLCVKPSTLPPAEEWMGPPPEAFRNSQGNKPGGERNRNNDNPLFEQTNKRPSVDRHPPRNSANPEDIILGPPRMTFSSTLSRANNKTTFDGDKAVKDADTRDRFAFRSKNGDSDNAERFRDRERDRDTRTNLRRRGDADQDSEGWSTVKPRKSFGHEGAERFHGRMGERPERFVGDRRVRDQDDRENGERPRRAFGEFSKEKEVDESDKPRRNGPNRNKTDQPWLRENDTSTPRERFDRSKSWRERTADDQQGEAQSEKPRERTYERRWDRERDHRQEREPEWLDEPIEEQPQAHTQEDFKNFMESMKAGKNPAKAGPAPASAVETSALPEKIEVEKTRVKPAPAIEMIGPDKFFAALAQNSNMETPSSTSEVIKENAVPVTKPKSGSRFQTFFSSQEESRRQPEPSPHVASAPPPPEINPLLAMAGAHGSNDVAEKVAFQALLQKLQKQTLQATPPPSSGFAEPPPNHIASPGPFQPYGLDRREEPLIRGPPASQDLHNPRAPPAQQYGGMRPEQHMLHELIGQRHPGQNQSAARSDQLNRNSSSNAEFLMTLMQGARPAPESQRNEPLAMRMPQPSRPAQILPTPDRELDFQHERIAAQHQVGRPTALPSFFDEPVMHHREQDSRPQQPTQILQRQVPPGLDQVHASWMQNNAQQIPPPGRPMIPPPGLVGNPRNGPIPGGFPPNFAMGGFPPEALAGPPRNMGPPPGFYGGPPPPGPGFIPPGMGGFQGPENVNVGFGFDHRGIPPPPGAFRRN
ncbi:hypothetical protein F4820DRAFT_443585 [Hypoxylon rubiginosum]|uniref:Uncharacterized protein n=1 Tax=Hypoxylon rubiginosum TaxID=110542 RepID=A0ACB9ZFT3_9PEZI|nr:hypothetical protein F4820DRAFT_443585 [Hypoxylon rubiginosum]